MTSSPFSEQEFSFIIKELYVYLGKKGEGKSRGRSGRRDGRLGIDIFIHSFHAVICLNLRGLDISKDSAGVGIWKIGNLDGGMTNKMLGKGTAFSFKL